MNFGFLGAALSSAVMKHLGRIKLGQPQIFYSEQGRDGYVSFDNGQNSFDMYWEFGGGDVLAIITVPTPSEWQQQTGMPLSQRAETLEFIARQVIKDKTSLGRNRYVIGEDAIKIFD